MSLVATYLSDRRKLTSEETRRWDNDIADGCSLAIAACTAIQRMPLRSTFVTASELADADAHMDSNMHTLTAVENRFIFIAPPELVHAATTLSTKGRAAIQEWKAGSVASEARNAFNWATLAFIDAARKAVRVAAMDTKKAPRSGGASAPG